MPQPSDDPRWNTDLTNNTDPPSGQKDTGWTVSQVPPSSYFNWWMNLVYQWVLYLKNLATEAFTWTAAHVFTAGITVTKAAGVATTSTGGTGTNAHGVQGTGGSGDTSHGVHGTAGSGLACAGVMGYSNAAFGYGVFGEAGASASAGVTGFGPIYGVSGQGFANGTGVHAVGAGVGQGAYITGGSGGGKGAEIWGGSNAPGVDARGNGIGHAIVALGGSDSRGIDATGGTGSNKAGVRGTGGSGGGNGVEAVGSAAGGHGISAWATTGHGGDFTGGGAYAGVRAARGDAFTNKPAIDSYGTINLDGSSAPGVITPIKNQITRNSIVKAWVLIQCNGTANPVILDGFNVSSVVQDLVSLPGKLTITFAQPMAGSSYAVKGLCENAPAYSAEIYGKAGASFNCRPYAIQSSSYPSHTVTNGQLWLFEVMGAQ